ncbi:MAG: hypothetical protein QG606_68 [Patescibacteria group bacterium]|jgi:hypothetical protein|nr:hypothetical protein [Patescibacteria group bacterium]
MSAHIVLWFVSGSMLLIGFYDIFRNLPKRHIVMNAVICLLGFCLLCLGMLIFFDEEDVPPASFAQVNTAVLATVKEGDLILCTDPATGQVKRAVLIHSVSPDDKTIAYGIGVYEGREVFEAVIFRSRSAKCKLSEPIRDPRLANERIGEIIRSGLNPPSPRK